MKFPRRHFAAPGFSLVELLVTLALMIILVSMLHGFASAKRQRTAKQLCGDNLQKIFIALQIYANDFRGALPHDPNARTAEAALAALVPKYTADTSIFVCPGGRDSAIPSGAPLPQCKISYAYYMGRQLPTTQTVVPDQSQIVLLTDRQINTEPKRAGEMIFSDNGKSPGNNHHKYGGNFLFADGSVTASGPQLALSLAAAPGVVLLNPKP